MSETAAVRPPAAGVELLGIEPLEEYARRLAALLTLARRRRGGGRAHLVQLADHARVLRMVYTALTEDARRGEPLSPAAEWLLDNYHVISHAIRDIRHDLPPSFFRRLPRIAVGDEYAGQPRVCAMAVELIRRSAGRLDSQRLHRFVTAFQSVTPLTIGELWAFPSALKSALVEQLRARADVLSTSRAHRIDADRIASALEASRAKDAWPAQVHPAFVIRLLERSREEGAAAAALRHELDAALAAKGHTIEDAIRSEGRHQAAEQAFMSNLIGSLRLISTFDWSEFFESVSLVEQVLQRDPASVYGQMDFRSRDRYRHAVEEMAEPTGEGQLRVALKSVERARQVAEQKPDDRGRARRLLPDRRRPAAVRARHRVVARARAAPPPAVLQARDAWIPRHDQRGNGAAGGGGARLCLCVWVARPGAGLGRPADRRARQRTDDSDRSTDRSAT